jgi:hypothetical protein
MSFFSFRFAIFLKFEQTAFSLFRWTCWFKNLPMLPSDKHRFENPKCIPSVVHVSWCPDADISCIGPSEHVSLLQSAFHGPDFLHPIVGVQSSPNATSSNLEIQEFHRYTRPQSSLCNRCCCLQGRLESVQKDNSSAIEGLELKIQQMRLQVNCSFRMLASL